MQTEAQPTPVPDQEVTVEQPDKVLTQAEVDRIVAERVQRERSKYADYGDLKAKAAKFAELQQAQMTETERTAARLAEMEREAATARAEALRFKVAARFGIGDEDADLFLTGSDESTITRQAERLRSLRTTAAPASPGGPKPDPSQGAKPRGSEVSGRDAGLAEAQRRFGTSTK